MLIFPNIFFGTGAPGPPGKRGKRGKKGDSGDGGSPVSFVFYFPLQGLVSTYLNRITLQLARKIFFSKYLQTGLKFSE